MSITKHLSAETLTQIVDDVAVVVARQDDDIQDLRNQLDFAQATNKRLNDTVSEMNARLVELTRDLNWTKEDNHRKQELLNRLEVGMDAMAAAIKWNPRILPSLLLVPDVREAFENFVKRGAKIEAIKIIRRELGFGLKPAKDMVEAYAVSTPKHPYIFMRGGALIDVQGVEEYTLVDWDRLTDGFCPVCSKRLSAEDRSTCPSCGINWNEVGESGDVIDALEAN
jgi:hypothetical protein